MTATSLATLALGGTGLVDAGDNIWQDLDIRDLSNLLQLHTSLDVLRYLQQLVGGVLLIELLLKPVRNGCHSRKFLIVVIHVSIVVGIPLSLSGSRLKTLCLALSSL